MSGSKTFVPLTASASSGKGLPDTTSSAGSAARSFVPFTAATPSASTSHSVPRHTTPAPVCAGKSAVEAITEDGVVTRIRVTCACGEVIEVDCLYPATA